ncbi:MAG: hypothetical protein IJ129_03905, partial [Ruminococcus sp.]|nr:hypothetical protein [Ruminococcus sp.]
YVSNNACAEKIMESNDLQVVFVIISHTFSAVNLKYLKPWLPFAVGVALTQIACHGIIISVKSTQRVRT